MGSARPFFYSYCAAICLLQMIIPSSEEFKVTGSEGPIMASFGTVLELSCQLSPPQNAEHMEIRWFRNHYTQPVYLYKGGKDMHGETTSKYVERTELLKDAIGEGRVTLRIFNVSVDDDGKYHCIFKDGEFYEEHITEVKVTATSIHVQIFVHPPTTKGLIVECHSGGWFPQPHMEWRGSRGEIIPAASQSHSLDEEKLFNMKMTLLLEDRSHRNVTCCFQHPLTGHEERANIVLSEKLFSWKVIWTLILLSILIVMAFSVLLPSIELQCKKDSWRAWNAPWFIALCIIITSVLTVISVIAYLHNKNRVSVSDSQFELDTLWLEDITVILSALMVFITMLISFVYFKLRSEWDRKSGNS